MLASCQKVAAAVALVGLAAPVDGLRKHRAAATCGMRGASARGNESGISIVNGHPAEECVWKWQVSLAYKEGELPFCGGMLISDQWVLTAAHCVSSIDVSAASTPPRWKVIAGDYKPLEAASGNRQVRGVTKVHEHPWYNPFTKRWDLALLKLDTPVEMNGCVGTICLPQQDADVQPGTKCWISGWGTLKRFGSQPEVLQEAQVTTISNEACVKSPYGYWFWDIHESMLCAQGQTASGETVDACQGDSGGPLVCETSPGAFTLFGATSWGRGCANPKYPGVWARVHEALDWIGRTMEK